MALMIKTKIMAISDSGGILMERIVDRRHQFFEEFWKKSLQLHQKTIHC
jgi:hypothetical protein